MDLTFRTGEGIFNVRVAAIIVFGNKLLTLKNDLTPYYFLPGGRVKLDERAESAIKRELKEELDVDAKIIRPLWLVESFFYEDTTKEKFHELCIYFLVDASNTDLIGINKFVGKETKHHEVFEWLDISTLKDQYLYPLFIKEKIHNLPEHLEILTEYEY